MDLVLDIWVGINGRRRTRETKRLRLCAHARQIRAMQEELFLIEILVAHPPLRQFGDKSTPPVTD